MKQPHIGLLLFLMSFVIPTICYADDWTDINCTESKITVPGYSDLHCQRGPEISEENCVIDRYWIQIYGKFTVEIHSANQLCYLRRAEDVDARIRTTFPWISGASNWSPTQSIAGASGAHMINRGKNCFSFYKPGPDRSGSGGSGIVWYMLGIYCAVIGETLDDQTITKFINSIEVR